MKTFVLSIVWLVSCFICSSAFGQKEVITSGGDANGSGGSSSYSVGQVVYVSNSSSSGSSAQGVQHAYEILSVSTDATNVSLTIEAYPNPTTDVLTLHFENYSNVNVKYSLHDVQGKVLDANSVLSSSTPINLSNYSEATYLLIIYQDNRIVQQFKIIKN